MLKCVVVLGVDNRPLTELITSRHLRWLGHLSHMSAHDRFAGSRQDRSRRRVGQAVAWSRENSFFEKLSTAVSMSYPYPF